MTNCIKWINIRHLCNVKTVMIHVLVLTQHILLNCLHSILNTLTMLVTYYIMIIKKLQPQKLHDNEKQTLRQFSETKQCFMWVTVSSRACEHPVCLVGLDIYISYHLMFTFAAHLRERIAAMQLCVVHLCCSHMQWCCLQQRRGVLWPVSGGSICNMIIKQ